MPRITISYRRDDSGVITGRIFDHLAAHYGRDSVFRDIDSIPPGADFREHIDGVLDESDVVLAVVGPRWLGQRAGQTRLGDEADPVRVEVETALKKGVPVVPVLVLQANMPRAAQLPDALKNFAYRNAVQIDAGQDFDNHIARLIGAVDRILGRTADGGEAEATPVVDAEPQPPSPAVPATRPARRVAYAGLVLAAALVGGAAGFGLDEYLRPRTPATPGAERGAPDQKAATLQKRLDELTSRLREAQMRAETAEKETAALKDARANALAQVEQLNARVAALDEQFASLPTFDDETHDYGVAPIASIRSGGYEGPTPLVVAGARTLTTLQLQAMAASPHPPVLIDVVSGKQTHSLPGAVWSPGLGMGASLSDAVQHVFATQLERLVGGDKQRAVVFFCLSKTCWLSHNATLRAAALGYANLYWYRGGRNAWAAAGLALAPVALYVPNLPAIAITPPVSAVPADIARFSGVWLGKWDKGNLAVVGVKTLRPDGFADIEYWYQQNPGEEYEHRPYELAKIENGVLAFATIRVRIDAQDPLKAKATSRDSSADFARQ